MPGGGAKKGERRGGRQKGTPNKITADLKEVILAAFNTAGGKEYLVKVATEDPRTFCTLLGKIVPTAITGGDEGDAPVKIEFSWQQASKG